MGRNNQDTVARRVQTRGATVLTSSFIPLLLIGQSRALSPCCSSRPSNRSMQQSIAYCGRRSVASFARLCRGSSAVSSCKACPPTFVDATTIRLLGTKRGVPDNPPGEINIYNDQTALSNINVDKIERTISEIRDIIDYPTYDVSLLLVDDYEMRKTNRETRGIDGPTDILSFPFQDVTMDGTPGVLAEPEFDIPDYYSLGDMMLDVAYVIRRCEEDRAGGSDDQPITIEGGENDAESDHVDDDRGVSGAMATVYDPEERIHMLLVHGILHLVGYDHIDDDDYELMVKKEEEVLQLLRDKGQIK